jgi:hypothetical protein
MRWAGYAAHTGEVKNVYNILIGKREGGKKHSEDIGVDKRIISEWILGK